jgi:hypothetical protein
LRRQQNVSTDNEGSMFLCEAAAAWALLPSTSIDVRGRYKCAPLRVAKLPPASPACVGNRDVQGFVLRAVEQAIGACGRPLGRRVVATGQEDDGNCYTYRP